MSSVITWRALAVAGAAVVHIGGCANAWVNAIEVQAIPVEGEAVRVAVILEADRDPPDCEIVGLDVRATVDGVPMTANGRGSARRGMVSWGVEMPPPGGCGGGTSFTAEHVPFRPAGTLITVRIEDGPHRLEVTIPNLLADYRVEADRQDAAPGEVVTLRVVPAGDLPLPEKQKVQVWISGPDRPYIQVPAGDVALRDRSISFKVPRLPPGPSRVHASSSDGQLQPVRCEGVRKCTARRVVGPRAAALTIR